jgi:CheY-like chemotaxis protein
MTNFSILLVEDNELNQKLIFLSLKKYRFNIDTANNGLEALEYFKKGRYDVILMDLMMPVMDGYEATRQIRLEEEGKADIADKVFIVGLTASVYDTEKEKCLGLGMNDFMTKPFDADRFIGIINERGIFTSPA